MQSKHSALSVVARLVGLVVAVMVLAGEFVSSYAASPTLFGQEVGAAPLPAGGLVAPALAVLFFSLCAVFGICALEAWEWVPPEVWLFNVPQSRRGAFRWFAALSLTASVVAMTLFYAERPFYLLNPAGDITLALQIATFVLLGLLVGLAGLVALWMVVVGLQALVLLVLAPVVGVGRLLRQQAVQRSERRDVVPAHSSREIGDDSMNQQCVGLYYGGAFGLQMRAIMDSTMRRLHADHLVGSSGLVNLDRLAEPGSVGQDVSPPRADQTRILAGAATPEQGYTEIFNRLGVAVFDANVGLPSIGSSLWFFLDGDVLPYTFDMLRAVKRQLPYHAIAVVTQLDEGGDGESDGTRNGLRGLREMWEEGVVATSFVVSARSEFTMTVKHSGGEAKQMEHLAAMLSAVLLAESQSALNRSCVEILRALGRLSPFVSCAFASARLTPLRLDGLARVRLWLRREEREVGHQDDMRAQTEHVARRVLTEQEYRATRQEMLPDRRALLVCTIPLKWTDRRFGLVHQSLMSFLARSFPSVASVMVRGNGVPMGITTDPLDRWYVQASCVYPLLPGCFEEGDAALDVAQGQQALPESVQVVARDRGGRFVAEPKVDGVPASNGTGKSRARQ